MAKQEPAHRIYYENNGRYATLREARRGQVLGVVISLAAIASAVVSMQLGGPWSVPSALVGVLILGVVKAIVSGRSNQTSDSIG